MEELRPDSGRYWRDHAIMAVVLMALAGSFLWLIDSPYPAIGSLGAILAVAVRAAYLKSETLGMVWTLTDRRLILPGGVRSVPLLEIERVRTLLGDVQVITKTGDKHLMKHLADGPAVVARITAARDKRAKRRA
ncbi:MAG: hypothetical protein KDK01_06795 [Rhodobacteraceae bacterium]|nr:hypothetical protein [Paracoccaceae bacterium]